jgi:hypothetical protein
MVYDTHVNSPMFIREKDVTNFYIKCPVIIIGNFDIQDHLLELIGIRSKI